MVIQQGEVYWLDFGAPAGSVAGYRRPYVVLQNNAMNQTAIATVIVCAVTSNVQLAGAPGNVLLDSGEGGLARPSVVNVSQVQTADKAELEERLGQLSPGRVREILAGLNLLLSPRAPA